MPPRSQSGIAIVTLHCPLCPRHFRTIAWIAHAKEPRCPSCDLKMDVSEVQDVSILSQPIERRKRA